jgi:hypothetical protein
MGSTPEEMKKKETRATEEGALAHCGWSVADIHSLRFVRDSEGTVVGRLFTASIGCRSKEKATLSCTDWL